MVPIVLLQSEHPTCWLIQLNSPKVIREMMLHSDGIHDQQIGFNSESETLSQPLDLSKNQSPILPNGAGGNKKNEGQAMAKRKKTRLLGRKLRKGKRKNKANHSAVHVSDVSGKMNTCCRKVKKMARKTQRTVARHQFRTKLLQNQLNQHEKLNRLQINQICDLREELRTSWFMLERAFLKIHALENNVTDLEARVSGNEFYPE